MPEAGQCPDDQEVENVAFLATTVSTQRNVNVIPEEGTQGNVPSAPKLSDRFGEKG